MGLTVRELELFDFRSYEHCLFRGFGPLTLFVGPNAIGKTNIVEAIQLTTSCSSFRNPRPPHLVRMGARRARVASVLEDDARRLELSLLADQDSKTYQLNGKKKTAASLRGLLPAIVFCPDDLDLVKGSSSIRRNQLDSLGSQVSPTYASVSRDYAKIVQQKNRYLKDQVSHEYLLAINDVLARVGSQLLMMRIRLVSELAPYVVKCYEGIASGRGEVDLSYVPSWIDAAPVALDELTRDGVERSLASVLESRYEEEHLRHRALFGPHADKVSFVLDGRDASVFASQGQQRSIVLAFKMAEVMLVRDRLNQNPVLLLDDVMSELDSNRRHAFMSAIPKGVQTFVTATTTNYFDEEVLAGADVVDLGAMASVRSTGGDCAANPSLKKVEWCHSDAHTRFDPCGVGDGRG